MFSYWTLLGSTVLRKNEWIDVLNHSGFTGDYKFNTADTLQILSAPTVWGSVTFKLILHTHKYINEFFI